MTTHNDLGKKGEIAAKQYLSEKGLEIIAENWRYGKGEIDIIAMQDNTIIFVEVKTRSSDYFGNPELSVSLKKQRQIIKTANAYIELNEINNEARFDIVAIVMNKTATRIEHIENSFYPLAGKHNL